MLPRLFARPRLFSVTATTLLLTTLGVGAFLILNGNPPSPLSLARYPVPPVWESPRFVLVAQHQDHPYWQDICQSARAAAAELGVDVEYVGPQRADREAMLRLLDMTIAAHVEGIIVQGYPDPELAELITKATDRGIPVVTVDGDSLGAPRRLTYVGSDNEAGGRMLAAALVQALPRAPVIAILHGGYAPPDRDPRVVSFETEVRRLGGRVVAVMTTELSPVVTASRVSHLLAEHPEVNALYTTAPGDLLGALQALDRLGRRDAVHVVGWAGSLASLKSAGDSGYTALVQDPEAIGRLAATYLADFLQLDQRPPEQLLVKVRLMEPEEEAEGRP